MRWVLPAVALALGVVAIAVSRSREVDLDDRGCAIALAGEPLGSFVFAWVALLVAGAGLCYAIVKNSGVAYAAVVVLIVGYLTLNLHFDADWRLTNDALGIEMCRK